MALFTTLGNLRGWLLKVKTVPLSRPTGNLQDLIPHLHDFLLAPALGQAWDCWDSRMGTCGDIVLQHPAYYCDLHVSSIIIMMEALLGAPESSHGMIIYLCDFFFQIC